MNKGITWIIERMRISKYKSGMITKRSTEMWRAILEMKQRGVGRKLKEVKHFLPMIPMRMKMRIYITLVARDPGLLYVPDGASEIRE